MPARTDFTPFGFRSWGSLGDLCLQCMHEILVGEGMHPIEATHTLHGEAFEVAPLWPVRTNSRIPMYFIVKSYDEKLNCVKDKQNNDEIRPGATEPHERDFYTLLFHSVTGAEATYKPECEGLEVYAVFGAHNVARDSLLRVVPCEGGYMFSTAEDAIQVYHPNVQVDGTLRGPITRILRKIDPDMSASCPPDALTIAEGDAEDEDCYCAICGKLLMIEFKKRSILGGVDFVAILDAMQEDEPHNISFGFVKHDFNGMYHRDLLDWYLTHTQRLQGSLYGIDPDFKTRTVYRVLCRVNSVLAYELSKPDPNRPDYQ